MEYSNELITKTNESTTVTERQKYIESVIFVNLYITEVTGASLPGLYHPPSNWGNINTGFVRVKTLLLNWSKVLLPALTMLPKELEGTNKKIQRRFEQTEELVKRLIERYDKYTAEDLIDNLSSIKRQYISANEDIDEVKLGVDKYSSRELELEVVAFNLLIEEFNSSIKYDKSKINKYSNSISSLKAKVRDNIAGVIGTGAAIAGTTVLIKLSKKIKGIGGAIIRGGLGLVMIGELIVVMDLINDIVVDTKIIEFQTREMDEYTLDVSALEDLVIRFNDVLKYVNDVQNSLNYISHEWGNLQSGIDCAIKKLENANKDINDKEYQEALQEIINSKKAWDNVAKGAQELSLEINVKDTVIDIDSLPSSDDSIEESATKMKAIELQIANAKSYPVMEYYKRVK